MNGLSNSPAQAIKEQRITSLEIAKFTGKLHKNILRDIKQLEVAWNEVTGLKFELSKYQDSSGRKLPMYSLSKEESLYISSKFDDVVRAKLVVRWHELEKQSALGEFQKPYGVQLYDHEIPLFRILDKYLVKGDIKAVADELGLTRGWVGKVKRGIGRSMKVMEALLKKAHFNKLHGITDGYKSFFATKQLSLFEG